MNKKEKYIEPLGLDLVDGKPDYSKTPEEDRKLYYERTSRLFRKKI